MSSAARVVILGQGYVGLPVSMPAVTAGFDVVGYDVDRDRVERLRRGDSYIADVADAVLSEALATGRYLPSANDSDLSDFDFAVVSVPTPLRDHVPDLSFIEAAADTLAPHVRPGCCVVLESTTYPGTTEDVFVPRTGEWLSAFEQASTSAVGYSPERIDPGNPRLDLPEHHEDRFGNRRRHRSMQSTPSISVLVDTTVKSHMHQGGRARQVTREHVPPRQHRPRERTDNVRP